MARAGVAYVPQGRGIFPKLTVEENLLVRLRARCDARRTIPPELLEMFPILKERRGSRPARSQADSSRSSLWRERCAAAPICCCSTSLQKAALSH